MTAIPDLQEALSNLSISSESGNSPPSTWENALDMPIDFKNRPADSEQLESKECTDTSLRCAARSGSTPPTPPAKMHGGRSTSSQAVEDPGNTARVGKYVPPGRKQAAANLKSQDSFLRDTSPGSPCRRSYFDRTSLPPSGARSALSTPIKKADSDTWRSSPSPSSDKADNPEFGASSLIYRTPLKHISHEDNLGHAAAAASAVSAVLCKHGPSAPGTPDSKDSDIVKEVLAVSPGLTKTSVKRAIHDAKAKGLTFNQKKHRSPSHIRRSQRRQQERVTQSPLVVTSNSPAYKIGSTPPPKGVVDPWEELEEENKMPCMKGIDKSSEPARGQPAKPKACVQLQFDRLQSKAVPPLPR